MNRCPPFSPLSLLIVLLLRLSAPASLLAQDLITVDVPLHAGWNLISNPVITPSDALMSIYPTGMQYGFTYGAMGWVQTTQLPRGAGVWDRFTGSHVVHVTGEAVYSDTFQVHPAWNVVGSISYPVLTSRITSNPPGIIISGFYHHDGGYVKADTIRPGFGYVVKISAAGEIFLSVAPFEKR